MKAGLFLICAILAAGFLFNGGNSAVQAQAPAGEVREMSLAQSDYVEHCGGCHGVQGDSAPADLPLLRGRVGYFMCTPETRSYLIRLPNVAHSRITDNDQLADLVNYMVFQLGRGSVPPGAKPFTGEEVKYERQFALSSQSLKKLRAKLVEVSIHKCGAPASLRLLYPSQKVPHSR